MKNFLIISLFIVSMQRAQALDLVSPNDHALLKGDNNNGSPFTESTSYHYQQVYDAKQFAALGTNGGLINFVGFRYNTYNNAPMIYHSMRVSLSTTAKAVDGLSSTFSENIGPDNLIVYSGNYTLGVAPAPSPFPMIIRFTPAFHFNPTNGNLLLDIQWPSANLFSGNGPPSMDAVNVSGDSVSRVFARNVYDTYIPTNGTADTIGLVTLFGVAPEVPPSPVINSLRLSGTNLLFAGTGGPPGGIGYTFSTTNLATPLTAWTPTSTNSFRTNGDFTFTNGVDATAVQQFYILQLQ
jgi:hypothetical protein